MILRVRTNTGVIRIECDASITLRELKEKIVSTLKISLEGAQTIRLALDLAGASILGDESASLQDLNIKHGSEVFVCDKFEKHTVEKSYVDSNGAVVPAGTYLRMLESEPAVNASEPIQQREVAKETTGHEQPEQQESARNSSAKSAAPAVATTAASAPVLSVPTQPVPMSVPAAVPSAAEVPFSYKDHGDLVDFEEQSDAVRAPDQAQRMTLLEDPLLSARSDGSQQPLFNLSNTAGGQNLMRAVMTAEELSKLEQLEKGLREAGLREWEVQQEVQTMQDELIAQRLQRDSDPFGDALTQAMYRNNVLQEDMALQMRQMDRTLQRFHGQPSSNAATKKAGTAGSSGSGSIKNDQILRLQAFQQTKQSSANTRPSAAAASSAKMAGPHATGTQQAWTASRSVPTDGRATVETGRSSSPSQHSELTTSVASTPLGKGITSQSSSGKGQAADPHDSVGSAIRQLDRVSRQLDGPGPVSNGASGAKLSALQKGALRTLSAPASAAAGAAEDLGGGEDGDAPVLRHQDELMALIDEFSRPAAANGTTGTGGRAEQVSGAKATAASTDLPRSGQRVPTVDRPALSLKDSGYKSMAQIKMEREAGTGASAGSGAKNAGAAASAAAAAPRKAAVAKARPTPIATAKLALPAKKAAVSSSGGSARATDVSTVKPTAAAARTPAPYSMQTQRGVLEGRSGSEGSARTGGVATTVVAGPGRGRRETSGNSAGDELDETLALALQMSLEDQGGGSGGGGRGGVGSIPAQWHTDGGRNGSGGAPIQGRADAPQLRGAVRMDPAVASQAAYDRAVAEADAAVLEARRLQELYDAEAAAEFLRYEEENEAVARAYQEQLNREMERPVLQQRLFGTALPADAGNNRLPFGALPSWLDSRVTEDANRGLLELAARESLFPQDVNFHNQQYAQQQQQQYFDENDGDGVDYDYGYDAVAPQHQQQRAAPWVGGVRSDGTYIPTVQHAGNPPDVMFDQDDEMLAQAIQESINLAAAAGGAGGRMGGGW